MKLAGRFKRRLGYRRLKVRLLLFILVVIFIPNLGFSQVFYGDPTAKLGESGAYRLEFGGGQVKGQNLRMKETKLEGGTTTQTFVSSNSETTDDIDSELIFLTGTVGLGPSIDIFGKIGQFRITHPLIGDYEFAGGLGVRFSPPQDSPIKIGLLLQAFYSRSGDDAFQTYIVGSEKNLAGGNVSFSALGTAEDELTMIRYDALIGFSMQHSPHNVHPYAGLLFTLIDGTYKGSFSGNGVECVETPPGSGSCSPQSAQVSFSFENEVSAKTSFGGVAGFAFNPTSKIGLTAEVQFGSQIGFFVSGSVRFK